jgi:hypothetical protein
MSAARFNASGGDIVWRPGSGPVVFLTIPEARETSLHALDAAENAQIADDFTGFERAIALFYEINDAIRAAMRWRHAARIDA